MKIAFYAWESLHTIAVGGVAVHVTELAAALERRGHEVHVFARLGEGQRTLERIDGVYYHRCPIELHSDFVVEMNNMGNAFAHFMGETEAHQGAQFDVVHAHDWLCAKGLVQAKNDRGRKTVLTFHSTEFGRNGNHHCNGRSQRVHEIEAEGAYVADRVITVSPALADEVKWLYNVPDWKIRVAFNGVSCERFDGYIDPGQGQGSLRLLVGCRRGRDRSRLPRDRAALLRREGGAEARGRGGRDRAGSGRSGDAEENDRARAA